MKEKQKLQRKPFKQKGGFLRRLKKWINLEAERSGF